MQGKDPSTVNFDDQDWDLAEGSSRTPPASTGGWKLAAAVAVGIVIGGTLMWAIDHGGPGPYAAPPLLAAEATPLTADPTAIAPAQQPQSLSLEPAAAGAPVDPRWPQEAERKAALALRAAQHAAERKERAWALFYKKPAACDDSPPKASLVECANHFIRAKREFEQIYAAGKLAPARHAEPTHRSASGL